MRIRPKMLLTHTRLPLVLLCACAAATAGCFAKKTPTARLAAVRLSSPNVPAAASLGDSPPDIASGMEPWPQLAVTHSTPVRPRVAPPPSPEPARPEKSTEPTIVPDVPTAEVVAAKNEAEQSLSLADKNLALAAGKNLNAMQQDLVSKVRGFAEGAREAMHAGDWARARTLSKKAEVLSDQLASSL